MKVTQEEKGRIREGSTYILKQVLLKELDEIKKELLVYKKDNKDYDLVLKGRGNSIKEIIELLGD